MKEGPATGQDGRRLWSLTSILREKAAGLGGEPEADWVVQRLVWGRGDPRGKGLRPSSQSSEEGGGTRRAEPQDPCCKETPQGRQGGGVLGAGLVLHRWGAWSRDEGMGMSCTGRRLGVRGAVWCSGQGESVPALLESTSHPQYLGGKRVCGGAECVARQPGLRE